MVFGLKMNWFILERQNALFIKDFSSIQVQFVVKEAHYALIRVFQPKFNREGVIKGFRF
jgi:hypothetical protein